MVTPSILFVCIHNAGRSQMAAAWCRELAGEGTIRSACAGTAPGDRVHPEVVTAMREVGIDLAGQAPQPLTDDLLAGTTHLITMGCGAACEEVPAGCEVLDWPIQDPKGQPVEVVRQIRDEVRARVEGLIRGFGSAATA